MPPTDLTSLLLACVAGATPALALSAWLTTRRAAETVHRSGNASAGATSTSPPLAAEAPFVRSEGRVRLSHRALERASFISLAVVAGMALVMQTQAEAPQWPVLIVGALCPLGGLWWVVRRGAFLPIARSGEDEIDVGDEEDDRG